MVNNQSLYYNHVLCNPLNAFTKTADVGVEIHAKKIVVHGRFHVTCVL